LILEEAADKAAFFGLIQVFIRREKGNMGAPTSTICRIFFSNVYGKAMYRDVADDIAKGMFLALS